MRHCERQSANSPDTVVWCTITVHVRFQPDVARHGLLNPRGAVRHCRCAVDLVQPDHTRVGMIHRGRSLDVMRVESFGKPEVNEFW